MTAPDDNLVARALQPVAPEPEAFADAVHRKLASREAELRSAPQATPPAQAAGLAPLIPALEGGAGAWLALPALSLAALGAVLLWALRGLPRPSGRPHGDATAVDAEVRAWWGEHAWQALLTLGLLALLGRFLLLEAVLGVVLLSLLHVTLVVRRLAAANLASRPQVGRITAELLGLLAVLALFAGDRGLGASERFPDVLSLGLLVLGAFLCDLLGSWSERRSPRARALGLAPTLVLLAILASLASGPLGPVTPAEVPAQVTAFDEPIERAHEWQRLARLSLSDAARGASPSPAARARLETAPTVPTPVLSAAAWADLLDDARWAELAELGEDQGLLGTAPLPRPYLGNGQVLALARRGLEPAQRDALVQALLQVPERKLGPLPLDTLDSTLTLLERLGQPAAGIQLEPFRRAFAQHLPEPRWREAVDVGRAHRTVRLARRLGLPADLDSAQLRRYLEDQAQPRWIERLAPRAWDLLTVQPYRFEAAAALAELRPLLPEDLDPPAAPWPLRNRLLLGVLALCALALRATWLAPPLED